MYTLPLYLSDKDAGLEFGSTDPWIIHRVLQLLARQGVRVHRLATRYPQAPPRLRNQRKHHVPPFTECTTHVDQANFCHAAIIAGHSWQDARRLFELLALYRVVGTQVEHCTFGDSCLMRVTSAGRVHHLLSLAGLAALDERELESLTHACGPEDPVRIVRSVLQALSHLQFAGASPPKRTGDGTCRRRCRPEVIIFEGPPCQVSIAPSAEPIFRTSTTIAKPAASVSLGAAGTIPGGGTPGWIGSSAILICTRYSLVSA